MPEQKLYVTGVTLGCFFYAWRFFVLVLVYVLVIDIAIGIAIVLFFKWDLHFSVRQIWLFYYNGYSHPWATSFLHGEKGTKTLFYAVRTAVAPFLRYIFTCGDGIYSAKYSVTLTNYLACGACPAERKLGTGRDATIRG
jgi:hypothetical protein